jgi:TonB family protein
MQTPPRISIAFAGSAAVHGLFIGALVLLALATPPVPPLPLAYTVSLVELPPPPAPVEPEPPAPAPRPAPPKTLPKPPPPALPRMAVAPRPPASALPDPFARAFPTAAPMAAPTPAPARPAPTATPSDDLLRRQALASRDARIAPAPAPSRAAPRASIQAPIVTDGPPFPYPHYLSLLSDRISSHWFPPPGQHAGPRAVLKFRIMRDGSVSDLMVEVSSGTDAVDRSALRAVLASSPLPPLPEGFTWESLGVHFGFDLSAR